jgi:hypothetical protein
MKRKLFYLILVIPLILINSCVADNDPMLNDDKAINSVDAQLESRNSEFNHNELRVLYVLNRSKTFNEWMLKDYVFTNLSHDLVNKKGKTKKVKEISEKLLKDKNSKKDDLKKSLNKEVGSFYGDISVNYSDAYIKYYKQVNKELSSIVKQYNISESEINRALNYATARTLLLHAKSNYKKNESK